MHIVYNEVQILHQLFAYSFPEYKAIGEYDRLEYDWKGSQRMTTTTKKKVTNYDEKVTNYEGERNLSHEQWQPK